MWEQSAGPKRNKPIGQRVVYKFFLSSQEGLDPLSNCA